MKKVLRLAMLAFLTLPFAAHSQNNSANATFSTTDIPGMARAASLINRSSSAPPGRLFFSPARRQGLDQQRKTLQYQETVVQGDTLALDGVVTRSSGRWTLWVNGSPVTERDTGNMGASPVRDGTGRARLSAGTTDSTPVVVAVGDSVERASGERSSPLGSGSIRVHSRAARH